MTMQNCVTAVKIAFVLAMLAAVGYVAYEITVWNYYTAVFVTMIAGPLAPQQEMVLGLFICSALIAPVLAFLLLLAFMAHERANPSDPERLRAKAEELLRIAEAIERYDEEKRRDRLYSERGITTVLPRRGPR